MTFDKHTKQLVGEMCMGFLEYRFVTRNVKYAWGINVLQRK